MAYKWGDFINHLRSLHQNHDSLDWFLNDSKSSNSLIFDTQKNPWGVRQLPASYITTFLGMRIIPDPFTDSLQALEKRWPPWIRGCYKKPVTNRWFFHLVKKKTTSLNSHGLLFPEKKHKVTKILRNYTSATVRRMLLDPELQSFRKNVQNKMHFGWQNQV